MTVKSRHEILSDLLESAGIAAAAEGEQLLNQMESWLGLRNDDMEMLTATDCDSIPIQVYHKWKDFLTFTWNTDGDQPGSASLYQNLLLEQVQSHGIQKENVQLNTVWISFRATYWLQTWMNLELEVMDQSYSDSASTNSPSRKEYHWAYLIASDTPEETKASKMLIQALYYHIQQLPTLQAHLHNFTNFLQQPASLQQESPSNRLGSTSSSKALSPRERLELFEKAQAVSTRLTSEWRDHVDRLQQITALLYRCCAPPLRACTRIYMGQTWTRYLIKTTTTTSTMLKRQENTQAAGIALTLETLFCILSTESENQASRQAVLHHLLEHFLVPLHQPNGLILWRDQTPLLSLYHEPLVKCTAACIRQIEAHVLPTVVQSLIQPEIFSPGNTNKQVLLLHELDTYLGFVSEHEKGSPASTTSKRWFVDFSRVLASCMASDHSGLAERALQFAKNATFISLVKDQASSCLPLYLAALVPKGSENHSSSSWNPTVRKMTYLVLNKFFENIDAEIMQQAAQNAFLNNVALNATMASPKKETPKTYSKSTPQVRAKGSQHSPMLPPSGQRPMSSSLPSQSFSGKGVLGTSWKPPPGRRPRPPASRTGGRPPSSSMPPPGKGKAPWAGGGQQPPATITGVAPWAVSKGSQQQPPVTITGVAPWAMANEKSNGNSVLRQKRSSSAIGSKASKAPLVMGIAEDDEEENGNGDKETVEEDEATKADEMNSVDLGSEASTNIQSSSSGFDRLLAYMEKIKPLEEEGGISSWSIRQMKETPTLLPSLKFHDLVFGHDLGSGSFGSVRYARHIDRKKTRSKWAEYAVKVVSTDKIKQLGYEASIQREIAVLRILSHPGIARLVSSFRFREGAYLVLEYASQGDLHSLLRKQGSLDHDATRFVVGEILAALQSIHQLGLGYFDLKPENIVVTEVGHIKLTDFGGCRPVTAEAKERIRASAKDTLRNLRDGDWVEATLSKTDDLDSNKDVDKEDSDHHFEFEDDARVEGTTAYLPPEVVMGAVPTLGADTWALGCVMYQCLSGRPPLFEIDDESTRHRIVSFASEEDPGDGVDQLFLEKHSLNVSPSAKHLIRLSLNRSPSGRPTMSDMAMHDFFEGEDVFSYHSKPAFPLEVGSVAPPKEDAKWARRQFSSIWAPQPSEYNLSVGDGGGSKDMKRHKTVLAALAASVIPEGSELAAFFSSKGPSTYAGPPTNQAELPEINTSGSSLGKISERG